MSLNVWWLVQILVDLLNHDLNGQVADSTRPGMTWRQHTLEPTTLRWFSTNYLRCLLPYNCLASAHTLACWWYLWNPPQASQKWTKCKMMIGIRNFPIFFPEIAPLGLARLQVDCDDLNDLTRPTVYRGWLWVTDRMPSAIEDLQAKHVHLLLRLGFNIQFWI